MNAKLRLFAMILRVLWSLASIVVFMWVYGSGNLPGMSLLPVR